MCKVFKCEKVGVQNEKVKMKMLVLVVQTVMECERWVRRRWRCGE